MQRPAVIAIGGFTSEVGKTTLMCDLLRAFPGWEAIKTTRGHYRSCGKEPEACCVSHLLSDQALIRSGREDTYATDKDTGRYWDAGASNVHWMIVTEQQVEAGINQALQRVVAPGVFVEGNSFTRFVTVDFMLMVSRAAGGQIKPSARRALAIADGIYLSDPGSNSLVARGAFAVWRNKSSSGELTADLPIFTRADLPELVARLERIHSAVAA
jgi:molybdopterin-guanine dinucleotide biosynthesis protein